MENQYKYTVCIRCITYNHEKYLADALEGFVMQKTTFPFVAIVHDDASTDGTADILRQYAEKYPDIIKPIYETENQYSKHDGSIGRIMDAEMAKYNPKYIAYCEGDDYWTDPYKLQKQVNFMESHPDYSVCFCRCLHHYVNTGKTTSDTNCDKWLTPLDPGVEITKSMFFDKWITQPLTMVYRSSFDASKFRAKYTHYWDTYMIYELLNSGKAYLINSVCGVHLFTGKGVSSSLDTIGSCQFELTSANELYSINKEYDVYVYWKRTVLWALNTYASMDRKDLYRNLLLMEFKMFPIKTMGLMICQLKSAIKKLVK